MSAPLPCSCCLTRMAPRLVEEVSPSGAQHSKHAVSQAADSTDHPQPHDKVGQGQATPCCFRQLLRVGRLCVHARQRLQDDRSLAGRQVVDDAFQQRGWRCEAVLRDGRRRPRCPAAPYLLCSQPTVKANSSMMKQMHAFKSINASSSPNKTFKHDHHILIYVIGGLRQSVP